MKCVQINKKKKNVWIIKYLRKKSVTHFFLSSKRNSEIVTSHQACLKHMFFCIDNMAYRWPSGARICWITSEFLSWRSFTVNFDEFIFHCCCLLSQQIKNYYLFISTMKFKINYYTTTVILHYRNSIYSNH